VFSRQTKQNIGETTVQKDTEKSETYQVLRDLKKDGKERPWRDKKMRSLKVAKSFARQGDNKKRADRVWNCGTYLVFQRNVETGERRLKSANFCRERLCPMCQWHKTAKMFQELSRVIDSVSFWHNNLIPLFLTLTIKNCKADESELSMTFNMISGAWKRLS
jgi:plasmid rolling circle replication initiator protein Rep